MKCKSLHVADALYRQPKGIPKNTEYSRTLLKNVRKKSFETNAMCRTIADPYIVDKLVNECAQDRKFDNVYRNLAVPFKTSFFTVNKNFASHEDSLDGTSSMIITHLRAQGTSQRLKQDTVSSHTITGRIFKNQCKIMWKAAVYVCKQRPEIINHMDYGNLQTSKIRNGSQLRWISLHHVLIHAKITWESWTLRTSSLKWFFQYQFPRMRTQSPLQSYSKTISTKIADFRRKLYRIEVLSSWESSAKPFSTSSEPN